MSRINEDYLRLHDIKNAIEAAMEFALSGLSSRESQFACAYCIAIIGEAASKISAELQAQNPDIPWRSIVNMRHRIVHDYGNIDPNTLRQAIREDIPALRPQILRILEQIAE